MATAVYPGLPTSFGGTIIQASTLLLQQSDYVPISWDSVRRIVAADPQAFVDIPRTKAADPNWTFYIRKDMTGTLSSQRTLVGIRYRSISKTRSVLNTSLAQAATSFKTLAHMISSYAWHVAEVTLASGEKFNDVTLSTVGATVMIDPDTKAVLAPTSGYLAIHEALGFILKPVAASVPTWDPAYAAIAGMNPSDV